MSRNIVHYNKINKEDILKAWREWPISFDECVEKCKEKNKRFLEFNGSIFDLNRPIDKRIMKYSFGYNGYRIIKSLNHPHLNNKGDELE